MPNRTTTRFRAVATATALAIVSGLGFGAATSAVASEPMFADEPTGVLMNTLDNAGVVPSTVWPPPPEQSPRAGFDNEDGLVDETLAAGRMVSGIWGVTNIGGYSTGGHIKGSDHYTGKALDIMLTPVSDANIELGWEIAHWLQDNAEELNISYIIFNGQKWNADYPEKGWRTYSHPTGGTSYGYAHHDHIHASFN